MDVGRSASSATMVASGAPHPNRSLLAVLTVVVFSLFVPSTVYSSASSAFGATYVLCSGHCGSLFGIFDPSAPAPIMVPGGLIFAPRTRRDKRVFRVFIVTFKLHDRARSLVENLLKSDLVDFSFEITVINNFGTFSYPTDVTIFSDHADSLSVINSYSRPEFSWGHLAHDWNVAVLQGIVDLDNPISDIVVCLQGDVDLSYDMGAQSARRAYQRKIALHPGRPWGRVSELHTRGHSAPGHLGRAFLRHWPPGG